MGTVSARSRGSRGRSWDRRGRSRVTHAASLAVLAGFAGCSKVRACTARHLCCRTRQPGNVHPGPPDGEEDLQERPHNLRRTPLGHSLTELRHDRGHGQHERQVEQELELGGRGRRAPSAHYGRGPRTARVPYGSAPCWPVTSCPSVLLAKCRCAVRRTGQRPPRVTWGSSPPFLRIRRHRSAGRRVFAADAAPPQRRQDRVLHSTRCGRAALHPPRVMSRSTGR
jgi:hypothetical protein